MMIHSTFQLTENTLCKNLEYKEIQSCMSQGYYLHKIKPILIILKRHVIKPLNSHHLQEGQGFGGYAPGRTSKPHGCSGWVQYVAQISPSGTKMTALLDYDILKLSLFLRTCPQR